jgi:hypothetical protein
VYFLPPDGFGQPVVSPIEATKAGVLRKQKGILCTAHLFCLVY